MGGTCGMLEREREEILVESDDKMPHGTTYRM